METINMEILSKEMVKPSSPTAHNLQHHKLSSLDQLAPPIYIPIIFFYQPAADQDKNHVITCAQRSQILKQSLSTTLTKYYPFAGRINGSFVVDCNDAGVEYIETRVHAQLAEAIKEPSMEELKRYLPKETFCKENGLEDIPLAIQINFFSCGGIAIGVSISHKIADASSSLMFMNAWAATCVGNADQVQQPIFDSANHFPPKDMSDFGPVRNFCMTREKIMTKRLVSTKEKLATPKLEVAGGSSSQVKDWTRVETVTAFFWRHLTEVNAVDGNKKSFVASHTVNLRPRMNPPLAQNSFGNIWWQILVVSTLETNRDYQNLVAKLRDAVKSINSNYIKKIQDDDECLGLLKKTAEIYGNEDGEFCTFTSWFRFTIYEVDFGWGKPVWVCTTSWPFKNYVVLMSTNCGEGIEAWVNMLEDDVAMIKCRSYPY